MQTCFCFFFLHYFLALKIIADGKVFLRTGVSAANPGGRSLTWIINYHYGFIFEFYLKTQYILSNGAARSDWKIIEGSLNQISVGPQVSCS